MIILLSPSISLGDEAIKPLIFFSNCDNPAMDKGLKYGLFHELGIKPETIKFGENRISNYKVLLIKGDKKEANHFSAVKQLFDFIATNSIHGRLDKGKYFGELNRQLFYSQEPLILTCGIIGSYFKRMLIEEMNFESKHIRKIGIFNKSCFATKAARKHYLKGGSNAI